MLLKKNFVAHIFFVNVISNAQLNKNNKQLLNADTIGFNKASYSEPEKIKTYLDFIFDNFRTDIGNTINICEYLYNRSVELNNKKLMASALNIKASIYALKSDYVNAAKNYTSAAQIFEQINEPYSLAMIYNNLGLLYNNTNNKSTALQYFQKGLSVANANNLDKPKALIYINLTNLYITIGNLDNALSNGLKADTLLLKLNLKTEHAVLTNLIGAIYFYKNNFEKAIEYYKSSYKLSVETEDLHSQNVALSNIGEVYALQKNPEALIILESPEKYFTTIKDYTNLQQVYQHYVSYFKNINNDKNTITYLEKLRNVDKLLYDSSEKKSIIYYQTKYETQQKENKILALSQSDSIKNLQILAQQSIINKNLLNISQQRLALAQDSILIITQNEALLQHKLDSSIKEKQINALTQAGLQKQLIFEKKVAAEKQKKQILYSILTATVLVAGLFLFALQQRHKKKQAVAKEQAQKELVESILATEEKERSRIAKDLHDGIVQDLIAIKFDVISIVEKLPESFKIPLNEIIHNVDTISKEVREISYQMMPVTLKELGLVKAIEELLNRTLPKNNIDFYFDSIGIEQRLSEKIEVTIYRICQELLNNTIKHSQAKNVSLLLQLKNNFLQLTYEDDGIGFNTQQVKKGIGLNSLNSRIEMVKGSLEFDATPDTGTTAYIRIPV